MSRYLRMRTTNWTSLSNGRASRTSTRLDRGEYEWDIVIFDANGRPKKRLTIRADDFDGAVNKALKLTETGLAITVDGRRFVK